MKITKEKYKEILEIQMIPYNENSRWFEETLTKINQALQLQQTDVIVQSEQLKTCEHNFADIYDHTGTQIVGKKCLKNCGF